MEEKVTYVVSLIHGVVDAGAVGCESIGKFVSMTHGEAMVVPCFVARHHLIWISSLEHWESVSMGDYECVVCLFCEDGK